MSETEVEVYVPLLEEGTPTSRGTQAVDLGNGHYRLLSTSNYDPEDEIWKFLPGSVVRCEERMFEGKVYLIAVANVK